MRKIRTYSLMEAAYVLGVSTTNLKNWASAKFIEQPDRSSGKPRYSQGQINRIRRAIRNGILTHHTDGHRYYNQTQLARHLGVDHVNFQYLVRVGRLPQPRYGTVRKYFRDDDIPAVREALANQTPRYAHRWYNEMPGKGWYNKTTAPKYLGMPDITFSVMVRDGRIPQPTHVIKYLKFYTREELDRIKVNELKDYFAQRDR